MSWCCPYRHECIVQKLQGIWHFRGSSPLSRCALQLACTTQLLGYPSQICLSVGEWTFEAQPSWRQVQDKLKPISTWWSLCHPTFRKGELSKAMSTKQEQHHIEQPLSGPSSSVQQQLAAPCSVAKSRANWHTSTCHRKCIELLEEALCFTHRIHAMFAICRSWTLDLQVYCNTLKLEVTLKSQNPCRSGLFRHSEEVEQTAEGSTLWLSDGFWRSAKLNFSYRSKVFLWCRSTSCLA